MPAPPVTRASLPGARWCWGCASPPRVPRGRGGLVAGAMPQEDPTGPSAGCRNNELLGEAADETAPRVARGLAAPSAPVQGTGERGEPGWGAARESGPGTTTPFPPPQPIPTALWLPLPSRLSRLASPPPPAILGWGLRSTILGVPVPPGGLCSISVRVLGVPTHPAWVQGGDVAVPGAPLSPAVAQHVQGGHGEVGGALAGSVPAVSDELPTREHSWKAGCWSRVLGCRST